MNLTNQEKLLFKSGSDNDRKNILKEHLGRQLRILKSSPDINILRKAQGQVEVLEVLLSTFD